MRKGARRSPSPLGGKSRRGRFLYFETRSTRRTPCNVDLFLLALAAPALFATLGAGTAAAQTDKPIRIGMTVSSAGTFALQAQSGQRGVEVWIDDVANSRGGIDIGGKKRKVELVKLDDRSDKALVPEG